MCICVMYLMYVIYFRSSHKDNDVSSKSAKSDEIKMTEAASIQGSPTEVTYTTIIPAHDGNGRNEPELLYAYASTGPVVHQIGYKILISM